MNYIKSSYKIVIARIIINIETRFQKNKKFPKNCFKKNKIRPLLKNPEKDFHATRSV